MNAMEIQTEARKMFEAQGPRAVAQAARKVQEYEQTGDKVQAEDWKRIEAALLSLRGPNAS